MHAVRRALLDRWRPGLGKLHSSSHPKPNTKPNGHPNVGSHLFANCVADSGAHTGANNVSDARAHFEPDSDANRCAIGGADHIADDRTNAGALTGLRRQRELLRG